MPVKVLKVDPLFGQRQGGRQELGAAWRLDENRQGNQLSAVFRETLASERVVKDGAKGVDVFFTRHHRPLRCLGRRISRDEHWLVGSFPDPHCARQSRDVEWLSELNIRGR